MTDFLDTYARPDSRWSAINAEARRMLAHGAALLLCDPGALPIGSTTPVYFVPPRPQIRMRFLKEWDIAPSPQGDGAGV